MPSRSVVVLLFGLFLLAGGKPSAIRAQCPTTNAFTGSLQVRHSAGCVPLQVETRSGLIGVQNVRYVYEYDGKRESPTSVLTTYTYAKPGSYLLLQLSEKDGLPLRACTQVWVYDTLPPQVALTACGTRATLTVTDPLAFPMQYDYFLVNWDDGQIDTIRSGQSRKEHLFTTADPRRIRVQGIHESDTCGGTAWLAFTPNRPPEIRGVEPVQPGAQAVQIRLLNPSGLALTLQQRVGNGSYGGNQIVPAGTAVQMNVPADTGQTTCYRLVPVSTCPGTNPSPEVCHTFPPTQPVAVAPVAYYFPDAFSPNNDGLNDRFGPVGTVSSATYQFIIVDRWGTILFATADAGQAWDGLVDSQPARVGVYGYHLRISTADGQIRQTSGRFNLLR